MVLTTSKTYLKSLQLVCLIGFWVTFPLKGLSADETSEFPNKAVLMEPTEEIFYARLNFYLHETIKRPEGLIVLVPGFNRDGTTMLDREWVNFARRNKLNICAVTFRSEVGLLMDELGYYDARRESGVMFIDAIEKEYGKVPPLLFYGFSGGAHFTSSFVQNYVRYIKGWCAYTAAWWEPVKKHPLDPPGIVACGDMDPPRLGPTFAYFKDGREMGYRWTWVKLENTRHVPSEPLEGFVRDYFQVLLSNEEYNDAGYYGFNGKRASGEALDSRTDLSWLPSQTLMESWLEIHACD